MVDVTTEISILVDVPQPTSLANSMESDFSSMTNAVAAATLNGTDNPKASTLENSTSNVSDTSDEIAIDTDTDTAPVDMNTTDAAATTANTQEPTALKILFLSSDTGGGHRASSESLANQFQLLYPGSTFLLHDVVDGEKSAINYFGLVKSYRHLSAHPTQWKILYEVTNSRAFELITDANMKLMCERATRKRIMSIDPDVVVSVHPMMTNVPQLSCAKIAQQTGKHIPIFTVVTDLGSGHCLWFAPNMERMFVGSDQIWDLAKKRGNVPDEKLVMMGLPIRHDFSVQAEKLGDRTSPDGKAYQASVRAELGLPHTDRATLLVMGGGEGVGSLSDIVNHLYVELVLHGIDALILVVCGRNTTLKNGLANRDWDETLRIHSHLKIASRFSKTRTIMCGGTSVASPTTAGCIEGGVTSSLRKILSSSSLGASLTAPQALTPTAATTSELVEEKKEEHARLPPPSTNEQHALADDSSAGGDEEDDAKQPMINGGGMGTNFSFDSAATETPPPGKVTVVGLGFVERMAEYMVAADILVSKAGPGTISEAAALSLPVMLTSFLPGQEEGNIDFVLKGGFGAYVNDRDPVGIAEQCVSWLQDDVKMAELSQNAKSKGAPYAARDIAKAIGDSTLKWKEINEENGKACIADILAERKRLKEEGKK
jgi:UDP-N-acetylglucosamine:LPS N-acetylglucosamine transferase